MKKIVSVILCAVMLLSCLSFVGCGGPETVEDINGLDPEVAFDNALQSLDEIDNYYAELDLQVQLKVWIVPIYTLNFDKFYFYTYNGENEHHGFSPETLKQLEEQNMSSAVSGLEKEVWYVDGMCYVDTGLTKYKMAASTSPLQRSQYEKKIASIVRNGVGDRQCYKSGDSYYFTIVVEDNSQMMAKESQKEEYTIYFNQDGLLEKTVIHMYLQDMVINTITTEYEYDDVPTITPPENAGAFSQR